MSRARWRQLAWVLTIGDFAIYIWLGRHAGYAAVQLALSAVVLMALGQLNPRGFVLWAFHNRGYFFWANAIVFFLALLSVVGTVSFRALIWTGFAGPLSLAFAVVVAGLFHLVCVRPLSIWMARRTRFRSDGRAAAGHQAATRPRKFYILPGDHFITPRNRMKARNLLSRLSK
jgi:hypothetical protein